MVAIRRCEWARFVLRPCAIFVLSLVVSAGPGWVDWTPPASAQSQPECSGACFDVRLFQATENPDGTTTLTWAVTNRCESRLGVVTFELPSGLAAVAPADGGSFFAPSGREYIVENPATAPFHGIRFVLSDAFEGASSGETETFVYVLPTGAFDATSTRFEGRAGDYVETLVVTPDGCCPVADAGPDQILECSAGSGTTTLDASGSSDPEGDPLDFLWNIDDGAQLLAGAIVPVTLGLGSHDILLTADDGVCASTDHAAATVVDTLPPTAPSCTADVVTLGSETCAANPTLTATANDACVGPISQAHTYSFAAPGAQTFTYSLADPSGNTTACTQTVSAIDVTPPGEVSCSGSTVDLAPTTCTVSSIQSATANDSCGGPLSQSHTYNFSSPGTQSFTYSFTDPSGNAATCTQAVSAVDVTPPTGVACPGSTVALAPTTCTASTVLSATGTDACAGSLSQAHTYNFNAPGSQSFIYSLSDPSGNATACTQTVSAVDATPPVASCPGAVVPLDSDDCTASITLAATASDACGGEQTASHAYAFSAPGSQSFTYSLSDPSGNATSCIQTASAVDVTPPEVEVGRPSVTLFKPLHQCRPFDVVELCDVAAFDTCDGGDLAMSITRITADEEAARDIQITSETTFLVRSERDPGGNGRVYNVHFDVIDAAGNSASESCKIEVRRAPVQGAIEDPVATSCTPGGDCLCS